MNCDQALEAISAALDGELSPGEQVLLDAHLAQCPNCQAIAHDFGVLSVALSGMEQQPPEALLSQVQAAMAPKPVVDLAAERKKRSKRAWRSMAAAVALVVCLGGVYAYLEGSPLRGADSGATQITRWEPEAAIDVYGYSKYSTADTTAEAPSSCAIMDEDAFPAEDAAPEEKNLAAGTLPAESARLENGITAQTALELVYDYVDGQEQYPEAVLDAAYNNYFLPCDTCTDTEPVVVLEYEGLSPNGEYFTFSQYSEDEHTLLNCYAVAVDGGEILTLDANDSGSDASLAYEAVLNSESTP